MSNYTQTTFFTPKDALPTSDPNKTIFGAAYDVEFANITTAIVSKLDIVATVSSTATAFIPTGAAIPPNGMYLPAANTVGFSSNTTLRLSINSAGNVIINAPSSSDALTISGLTSTNVLRLNSTGANSYFGFGWNQGLATNAWNVFAQNTDPLAMGTSGASAVTLYTSAVARITASSAGNVTIAAPASGNTLSLSTAAAGIPLSMTDGTVTATATFAGTAFSIGPTSAHTLNLNTNGSTRIATTSAGNVTIAAPTSGTNLTLTQPGVGQICLSVGDGSTNGRISMTAAGMTFAIGQQFSPNTSEIFTAGTTPLNIGIAGLGAVGLWTNSLQRVTIASTGGVTIAAPSSGVALAVSAFAGTHSTKIADSANASFNAGYLELPINGQATPYTAVLADASKALYYSAAGAAAFTIPSNAAVAYPLGTTLTFVNDATGATSMTIAINADVLALSPGGTTGPRTLAQFGRATAHKVTATRWIISGTGLT